MNVKMTQSSDEVCLRILEAAAQRFTQFGYNFGVIGNLAGLYAVKQYVMELLHNQHSYRDFRKQIGYRRQSRL